jgi:hypothetical protein
VRGVEKTNTKETNGHERRGTAVDGIGANVNRALSGTVHIARGAIEATEIAEGTTGGRKIASATVRERSGRGNRQISLMEKQNALGVEATPSWRRAYTSSTLFPFYFIFVLFILFHTSTVCTSKAICMHSDGVCLGSLGDTRLEIWRHYWRFFDRLGLLSAIEMRALGEGSSFCTCSTMKRRKRTEE